MKRLKDCKVFLREKNNLFAYDLSKTSFGVLSSSSPIGNMWNYAIVQRAPVHFVLGGLRVLARQRRLV